MHIFKEANIGVGAQRPQLDAVLESLFVDDILIVTHLICLARSSHDLHSILLKIEAKGAKLKPMTETWADTTAHSGRFILEVIAGLEEFGRQKMSTGRTKARIAGQLMGRPQSLTKYQRELVLEMRREGKNNTEISLVSTPEQISTTSRSKSTSLWLRKFVHRPALRSGPPSGRRSCAGLWSNWA